MLRHCKCSTCRASSSDAGIIVPIVGTGALGVGVSGINTKGFGQGLDTVIGEERVDVGTFVAVATGVVGLSILEDAIETEGSICTVALGPFQVPVLFVSTFVFGAV